jgi:pimeloyl-ACP methyl ester carboxylesterase
MIRSTTLASGRKMGYREEGSGTTLLQVHGIGTGHQNFDLLTPHLAEWLHLLDIDLPGYGESDFGDANRSVTTFANAVAEFIDAMRIAPAHVHGTSMGGAVALALAANHPALVDRLVITCSFARLDRAALVMHETWRSAAAHGGAAALAELTSQQGFSRSFWDRPESAEVKAAFIAAMESTTPSEFLRDLDVMKHLDLEQDVQRIEAETLLLGADEDMMTPVRSAPSGLGMTDLERLIPRARLDVFDQCGHFISIERSRETAERVARFVLEDAGA